MASFRTDRMGEFQNVLRLARSRIQCEMEAVAKIQQSLGLDFVKIAGLVFGCCGKVFVTGSGTSGAVARRMAHLFAVTGTPAVYLQPMDALHGDLGAITCHDVIILISKLGGSNEINELARRSKERGAVVIALTCKEESELTEIAHISQVVDVPDSADLGGVIAMGSTLAHSAWGDAMATVLMSARGYSWETVSHSHPGGAVGLLKSLPKKIEKIELTPLTLRDFIDESSSKASR